jgi:hypothetical protein
VPERLRRPLAPPGVDASGVPDSVAAAGSGLDAEETYRSLTRAFDHARRTCPEAMVEVWYRFAGRLARMRCVGRRLAERLGRPFSHLRANPEVDALPELRIDLWDEAETGVTSEGCRVADDAYRPGQVAASDDGRFVTHARSRTRTGFDGSASHLVGWAVGAERLTLFELGRPLHSQLLLWLSDRGVQPVHAGLVALDGRGVLFGGPGGSGKTTVALTCLEAGFQYLADDYVGLESANEGFIGHSLYVSTHIDPKHLRRFPALLPHAIEGTLPIEEKYLVLLPDVFPAGYASQVPIRAVVLPHVTGADRTSWRRASRAEALLRLAPSSLFMLPHVGAGNGFQVLSRLVESVPVFRLDLGADLPGIPQRIAEILAEAVG